MVDEFDLNNLLSEADDQQNTDEISLTLTTSGDNSMSEEEGRAEEPAQDSVPMSEAAPENTEAPAPVASEATPENTEEAQEPVAETTEEPVAMQSLNEFIGAHRDKIENATLVDLSTFSNIPTGKHIMFKTMDEDDASLIMFDHPNQMWIEQSDPESIKVESSGIVIENATSRIYAGKSNMTKFNKDSDGKIIGMQVIGKSKTQDAVKVKSEEVESSETDVEATKLHVKRISARLYGLVMDSTDRTEIRTKVDEFMSRTKDVNHLIKIDKELLLTCQL